VSTKEPIQPEPDDDEMDGVVLDERMRFEATRVEEVDEKNDCVSGVELKGAGSLLSVAAHEAA
jgi:hypothetical protein